MLRDEIQRTRTDLGNPTPLAELASQFGHATGGGKALRTATMKADPSQYATVLEAHERGALLVAAVFDAFFQTYQRRTRDLIRIASGGSGRLPEGDLHPALVQRIATEAATTAQAILTMCMRAFEYLPPVDVTFGDFLRALVTADFEMAPRDAYGQRALIVEAFRLRGIYPEFVNSLAEASLVWDPPERRLAPFPNALVRDLASAARELSTVTPLRRGHTGADARSGLGVSDSARQRQYREALRKYARQNARALHLDRARDIEVRGFHSCYRISPDGQLLVDIVAQFAQTLEETSDELGGAPLRGGTTVVASSDGVVRYVIAKPLVSGASTPRRRAEARARRDRQYGFVEESDRSDAQRAWCAADSLSNRMHRMHNFASLHADRG